MAVVESAKKEAVKLVTLHNGDDGTQRQRTTTLSNIVESVSNDKLMQGVGAVISMLQVTPAAVVRVTEVTLTNQA